MPALKPSFWMYTGSVGQGKTIATVRDAILDVGHRVYAHRSMGLKRVPDSDGSDKELIYWDEPDEWADMECGVVLVDECDMFFNSREFQKLSPVARRVMKEHRKQHLRFVANTQHVSFVDKLMRTFVHEVRVMERSSIPLYGLIRPEAMRATSPCRQCNEERDDLVGDDRSAFTRALRFGTRYSWTAFAPAVLMGDEDTGSVEVLERAALPEEDPRRIAAIGKGGFPFTPTVAECYDTSAKMSDHFHRPAHAVA